MLGQAEAGAIHWALARIREGRPMRGSWSSTSSGEISGPGHEPECEVAGQSVTRGPGQRLEGRDNDVAGELLGRHEVCGISTMLAGRGPGWGFPMPDGEGFLDPYPVLPAATWEAAPGWSGR